MQVWLFEIVKSNRENPSLRQFRARANLGPLMVCAFPPRDIVSAWGWGERGRGKGVGYC